MEKPNDKVDLLGILRDKKEKRLTVKQVAEDLGISPSTVYRLIEEGQLKAIRAAGRGIMVLESSVEKYLESLNPLLISE
jgi:excisionase family DNA binding protein